VNKLKGFLSLLSAGIIFGSFGVWIRLLSKDLTIYQQVAFRNIIGLAIAASLIIITKPKISFKNVKKKHLVLFAIVFPLTVILYNYSFLMTKIVLGIFSFYVGSILSSLGIGLVIFKEKITSNKLLSLFFAFVGLLFIIVPAGIGGIDNGMILGLIAGVLDTITNSFRKHLSGKVDRLALTSIPLAGGFIISLMLMAVNSQSFFPQISSASWLIGIMFGALLFLVNYLLFIGFSNFDLNLGTIVVGSELFFAPLFAALAFSELPSKFELIGGVFIVCAVLVANLDLNRLLRYNKQ
jgi:drug/metabolite transporter (DMT)-like permease